jgi:sodium/potassium-transporting ATPase subunit alpha
MCLVIRDGGIKELMASKLVLGDLVLIRNGDKIPADLRLASVTDLRVDNSSITGESEPQERLLSKGSNNPLEASNLAFSGTMAVSGEGLGIVIRVGDQSILGQIAKLTITEQPRASQLSAEINTFVRLIALVATITAVVFFVFGLVSKFGVGLTFSFAIGTFVAYVPQGLPATVTLLLSIAAKRLSKQNVLVKNLHAVETLGSITLLATDKTGTLTQNKMSVVGTWINGQVFSTLAGPDNIPPLDQKTDNLDELVQICALCTKYFPLLCPYFL